MSERYARITKFIEDYPFAMLRSSLETMLAVLEHRLEGDRFTAEEIAERVGASSSAPARRTVGSVAVLPVYGVLSHRMNMLTAISGGMSTEQLAGAVRQATADPAVSAILLDIDSPGGSVFGVQELADEIFRARGPKPIVAIANATAASAAYWVGAQADEFLVTPSGQAGSIGVIAVHRDASKQAEMDGLKFSFVTAGKFKGDGNDVEPLDEATRADMQHRVDQYYSAFVRAVARGRGVTPAAVRDGFGEGRVVSAPDAVKLGMADGLATLDQAVGRLTGGSKRVFGASAMPRALRSRLGALDDVVDPDEEGGCPEGYEKWDDGLCHPVPPEAKAKTEDEVAALRRQLAERGA